MLWAVARVSLKGSLEEVCFFQEACVESHYISNHALSSRTSQLWNLKIEFYYPCEGECFKLFVIRELVVQVLVLF